MNKQRRKIIEEASKLLNEIQGSWDEIIANVSSAAEEEREAYDNMPEGLQSSERGEQASAAADALEEAQTDLESIDLGEIIGKLEEAIGS